MDRPIRTLHWTAPDADQPTDVMEAVTEAVLSATPHPDENIDRPKGYSVILTLAPDRTAFAEELQQALMALDPATVTLELDDADARISDLPVGVSKVPYPGEQNEAELSVKPEGHEKLHPYFT
ncbi:MAG: hypothetical protein BRD55_01230 [Bacteroidetes bacterium SW_9_63_38]|nr:MAG: hypothetical protein BRD55_01230 [Bacteroidetes bacterium SW_9_63_38]